MSEPKPVESAVRKPEEVFYKDEISINGVGGSWEEVQRVLRSWELEIRAERDAYWREKVGELERQKNGAYTERNRLVALASKLFPSWLERHPESDVEWEDDWRWIVFVRLPTGQASWHIHDSELETFDHLGRQSGNSWDGHSDEEKYRRVDAIMAEVLGNEDE